MALVRVPQIVYAPSYTSTREWLFALSNVCVFVSVWHLYSFCFIFGVFMFCCATFVHLLLAFTFNFCFLVLDFLKLPCTMCTLFASKKNIVLNSLPVRVIADGCCCYRVAFSAQEMASLFPDRVIAIRGGIDNISQAESAISAKLSECIEHEMQQGLGMVRIWPIVAIL